MTEKLRLDLPLLLPEVPDSRDACVDRLESLITRHPGVTEVHLVEQDGRGHEMVGVDPASIDRQSVGAVGPVDFLRQCFDRFEAEHEDHPEQHEGEQRRRRDGQRAEDAGGDGQERDAHHSRRREAAERAQAATPHDRRPRPVVRSVRVVGTGA